MGAMQRRKGACGEREAAAALSEIGVHAKRTGQTCGLLDGADIETALPGCWFEVKRVERLNLAAAMDQARLDGGISALPVVLHRSNRRPWLVTLHLRDVPQFCKTVVAALAATVPPV